MFNLANCPLPSWSEVGIRLDQPKEYVLLFHEPAIHMFRSVLLLTSRTSTAAMAAVVVSVNRIQHDERPLHHANASQSVLDLSGVCVCKPR